jgi:hypothetical protein
MRYLRRYAGWLVAVLLVPAVASCGSRTVEYHADWPSYESVEQLYARADLVVVATVRDGVATRELKISSDGSDADVFTVAGASVVRAFKGDAKTGASVTVKQLGGEYQGVKYTVDDGDTAYLRPGVTYVLFLATFPDFPGVPPSLLNPTQAQYELDGSGRPTSLAGNPITFSMAELSRLSGMN